MAGMRYQPQGLLRIARTPLAVGLRLAMLPGVNRIYDAASAATGTALGVKQVAGLAGLSGGFGTAIGQSSTDRITVGLSGNYPTTGRSYFLRARRSGAGGGSLGRLFDKTSGGNGQFLMWYGARNSISYGFYTGGGTERNIDIPLTATTAAIGETFDLLVVHRDEGTQQSIDAYVSGGQVLAASVTAGANRDASTALSIGNRADGVRGWDGLIECVYVWDRAISPDEAAALSANRYQLFFDPYAEEDDPAPALKNYTLTAEVGAFGLAGSAAALRVSRRLDVAAAAYSLVGRAANLRASRRVAVAPGAYEVNGGEIVLRAARRLVVTPSAFALAGADASLRATRALSASAGSFNLAGGAAALVAARRLSAATGSFAIVGQAATLVHTAAPAPGGPTYVLTATAGNFALTGAAVAVIAARRLVTGAGVFGIAGAPVRLLVGRRLSGAPGAFDVSGAAALLQVVRRLPAAAGSFTLVGSHVVFTQSGQIEYARAPAGAGYAPRRSELQARPVQGGHQVRPGQAGSSRPAATQKAYR